MGARLNSFETADLSKYQLPADEPLSSKVIEMNQKLALAVLMQAIEDLGSADIVKRQSAQRFCLSDEADYHAIRMLWLGWIGMDEETFARAAAMKVELLGEGDDEMACRRSDAGVLFQ